jgi:nicotinamide mononucleotide (NMN) deamidase PncC
MLLTPDQLAQQIHDSPTRIVLATAGGGSRAIADLLEVPGGSRTLLEAVVPYSASAMAAFLGGPPEESCSSATAGAMAMAAFRRARRYEEASTTLAGVACTASLTSDRPKRGPHRVHVAVQTAAMSAAWNLQLHKGRRSRAEEERLAGRLTLNVVAEACGVDSRLKLDLLEGESPEMSRAMAPRPWQDLLLGNVDLVRLGNDAGQATAVFPGAFNPLHAGHRRMIEVARDILQQPVAAEISILNVDKPPLDYLEIERRVGQFTAEQPVHLTQAATFEEKSRLYPAATFLVGIDTLQRIAAPSYYPGAPESRQNALRQIADRGCRFLVFSRVVHGNLVRLSDLDLPEPLQAICREVPPEIFRDDSSSTAIRQSEAPPGP